MASDDALHCGVTYIVPEKHRRAKNWTDAEMKGLMFVWEEYFVALKSATRNAKIYERMANRLYEITGERRHREEIKMKLTNMTFQYRKLKQTTNGVGTTDWPYYSIIENILAKPYCPPGGSVKEDLADGSQFAGPSMAGGSTDATLGPLGPEEGLSLPMRGFITEYTGSSDEKDVKVEELSDSSVSIISADSRNHSFPAKRRRVLQPSPSSSSLKKRKLQVMEAMLQEQRKMRRAMEDTCREVQRVMQQQNLMQVQNQKLQERMMNLLERMVWPRDSPQATGTGAGTGQGLSS